MTERAERTTRDAGVRPISHLSLVDMVTAELRRAILTGGLQPGSTVSIVELCQQFDVSHIPVREALRRLESEGVVSLRPGRSAVVAPVSTGDLADIYRLRRLVEGDLAGRAARRMDAAHLAEAERLLEEYAGVEREPELLAAAHHRFDAALLAPATGETDTRVLQLLWHAADRYLHLLIGELDMQPAAQQDRIAVHRELLDLAKRSDATAFRKAWIAHLGATEDALRAALEQRPAR